MTNRVISQCLKCGKDYLKNMPHQLFCCAKHKWQFHEKNRFRKIPGRKVGDKWKKWNEKKLEELGEVEFKEYLKSIQRSFRGRQKILRIQKANERWLGNNVSEMG